ncbi:MAG: peptidoglycan bridge formation glycyltransferase FemA/FemB family protein [Anaerolineales bacterium]|nr:peptidoglycan bridge formation glycyltransferase FemA/FemB family protein [Anaerolineales bacterium]
MTSLTNWEEFIQSKHPDAHLLQTAAWARLKSGFGWQAETVQSADAGAMVLFRPLPLGVSIAYLPRGPVPATISALSALLPQLDSLCRSRRAAFLKIEPDIRGDPAAAESLGRLGFRPSPNPVQPPRTIKIDLRGSEDEILARMKPKTRYNIRLAMRHGVTVSASEDLAAFERLMNTTGARDAFAVHAGTYYQKAFAEFGPHRGVELMLAGYEGEALAGLMVFAQGRRAWYLYGASSDAHREVMAPYLLQWEAIRWARARGCAEYDLWGIPDADPETLEKEFSARQDGLWGVYRFKRGFGGLLWRSTGAWDRVYNPLLYGLYRLVAAGRPGNLG